MTQTEALRLALEALKEIIHWYAVRDRNDVLLNFVDQNPEIKKAMKAITVIEAAKEAKDEPVAWLHRFIEGGISIGLKPLDLERHPERWEPLYTTPPQRKPLTDEEIEELDMETSGTVHDFVRAIEAAHGIKGEAK